MKFLLVSEGGTCLPLAIANEYSLCLLVAVVTREGVGDANLDGALLVARRTAQMVGMPYNIYAMNPTATATSCYSGTYAHSRAGSGKRQTAHMGCGTQVTSRPF